MASSSRGATVAQFARFAALGAGNTAAHAVLVVVMVEVIALAPTAANVIAFLLVTAVSFLLSARFVFHARPSRERLVRFFVVAGCGAVFAALTMEAVLRMELHYLYGVLALALILPVATYIAHRTWTFVQAPGAGP
jgi:putative flippase GtrA